MGVISTPQSLRRTESLGLAISAECSGRELEVADQLPARIGGHELRHRLVKLDEGAPLRDRHPLPLLDSLEAVFTSSSDVEQEEVGLEVLGSTAVEATHHQGGQVQAGLAGEIEHENELLREAIRSLKRKDVVEG